MGYSHYFNTRSRELNKDKFLLFSDQCKRIINIATNQGIELVREYGNDLAPNLTPNIVEFNGANGHEDFVVKRNCSDFCKTAEKEYDVVVVACLTALKTIFEHQVDISSDGVQEDWQKGYKLYSDAIGMEPQVEIINAHGSNVLVNK